MNVPRTATLEFVRDLVDALIDLMLNYRQSGHPGGSRSKVPLLVSLALSGHMRWDALRPWRTWADRFLLCAGHAAPAGYALLAVLHEALRLNHLRSGSADTLFARGPDHVLLPSDLLGFRRRGGLPGHAEMADKTLFFKWNTGPSGHGLGALVGQAMALKYAGAADTLVWGVEGEGGLTPGMAHEARNTAWGLGLSNARLLVDWNDFGIDARPCSSVVHGTPADWFSPAGWRVEGTLAGEDFPAILEVLARLDERNDPRPAMGWFRTRKGRGYGKYDAASHGTPHPMNSPAFWDTKRDFQERYSVRFEGFGQPAPMDPEGIRAQFAANVDTVIGVLRASPERCDAIAERLLAIAATVPDRPPGVWADFARNPTDDPALLDETSYPFYLPPGTVVSNKQGLAAFGAHINATSLKTCGRPLFLVTSADLADSTSISGFGADSAAGPGLGWYDQHRNPKGVVLPQEITEAVNAGLMCALASVNFADDPFVRFAGFFGAASTYGAFSYLKYGMARLFSQVAQDCPLKMGKFLWIAGHSGPETAEDARTHFGVHAPGVTRLFPRGHVINLHPWEYNEVPVMLAAALREPEPIVVCHLTRPAITLPDRAALGMASHFAAARGAYLIRDFDPALPEAGTVLVQGTITTHHLVRLLPRMRECQINVRVVAAVSWELFCRQPDDYRNAILPWARWLDSMVVTNGALDNMSDWLSSPVARQYSMAADWDHRWRTGGSIEEVYEEAHLDPEHLLEGIARFARERDERIHRLGCVTP